jgi:hypothetical protein
VSKAIKQQPVRRKIEFFQIFFAEITTITQIFLPIKEVGEEIFFKES